MFDFLGADTLLAVRFFLAFIVVLAVIGVAAWAVRRLGSARIGHAVRGRLPRLGVSDYASVDSRRRLVLVRRDNIEHLVMIGGPTDVVVEANIAKEGPISRATAIVGDPEPAATSARTLPLPEDGAKESWPLPPEYPPSRPRAPRNVADENIPLMHDEFQVRPQRGAARPQESAPLPLAPEPPVDPLSQRRGRSMPPVLHWSSRAPKPQRTVVKSRVCRANSLRNDRYRGRRGQNSRRLRPARRGTSRRPRKTRTIR